MILAIESSCDDSAISITEIDTKKVIFHKRISQEAEHSKYGGVVPELAARMHADNLPDILELTQEYLDNIKAVAVTNAPGLTVSLLEGVMMAKAIAIVLNVPIIPINHIVGHIYSVFIESETIFPISALVVSGGHTQIVEVESYTKMRVIGNSMDDSIGESFDKVAKMLGLGYPGGQIIEQMANNGDNKRFKFTVPLKRKKEIAFSYSGLKNSVRLAIDELGDEMTDQDRNDIAASFQKTAFEHILDKLKKYFLLMQSSEELFDNIRPEDSTLGVRLKESTTGIRPKLLAIVGGVSANQYFREHIVEVCLEYDITPVFAALEYCSDNAAMIGRAAIDAHKEENFVDIDNLDVKSRVNLENI